MNSAASRSSGVEAHEDFSAAFRFLPAPSAPAATCAQQQQHQQHHQHQSVAACGQ